jgi:assimilatory nitrate reductase catalytic subunit
MRRIEDARRANPQQRMIVVDPRKTETADMAELHLQILPGSDIALYHGMLHLMLWEGWIDNALHRRPHPAAFDAS